MLFFSCFHNYVSKNPLLDVLFSHFWSLMFTVSTVGRVAVVAIMKTEFNIILIVHGLFSF